jgi:hypothetical protein
MLGRRRHTVIAPDPTSRVTSRALPVTRIPPIWPVRLRGALVHFQTEGEITPNPKLLCHDRLATDGIRVSGRQHPIQHRRADGSLNLLSRKAAGPKPRSDQHLVATHRCFYQRTSTVVAGNLPDQSPLFRDHLQMAITLCRRTCFAAWYRRRARRDHHFDIIATRRDRLQPVAGF